MKKKTLWVLFAAFSMLIGLYPVQYIINEGRSGILKDKPDWLLNNEFYTISFYIHIVLGGLALLIGWVQFSTKLRRNKPHIHQFIGKLYVLSALLSAGSGFYIALFANNGPWTSVGFCCLAAIWFYTTLTAFFTARNKQFLKHRNKMIYSYAACFAAVTLRIWLPVLIILIGNYSMSYNIVAWLSWIPNLLVAYLVIKRSAPETIDR